MWNKIKLILKSVRQYKKYAILTPLFMVGETLLESCLPFIMSLFIDVVLKTSGISDFTTLYETSNLPFKISLMWLIIAMVSMAILSLFFGIMGGRYGAKASVGLATNLRADLFRKIESFSFANIDKFSTSSLVTRMTTDIQSVQQSFQMLIRIVFRAPLMMIFSAVMAFATGGHVAWIFIALIPILGSGLFFIIRGAMKIFTRVFKRYDKLNESVQENVSGIRVVKSFVREEFEKEKFNKASDNVTYDFVKAEKLISLNNPLMNTTVHISNLLVVGICSYLISKTAGWDPSGEGRPIFNGVSVGQLSALLTYGIQILMSILMIASILVMFAMSLEAIRRIGEVLEEKPNIVNPEDPIMEVADGSISFDNVDFKYSSKAEKNTLEDINIHIKPGQFIGILGSTGSGKTSVANLISRLYDVSDGVVKVGGQDVRKYDIKTLRNNVAVVLQKNVLFSGTIADNLKWGNENATPEEMTRACEIAQAQEFISQMKEGLNSHIEQGGSNVSGGQKQRLCIARAIIKKPKVLILDDSTSAVDTKTDRLIRKGLKEDLPEMTKIVIAQRISSIEEADQIIILNDGKVNAIGTHEELIAHNKIYQEVYYTQNRAGGEK
ncbi:MAG: ABC transporter ATP-binding protein [Bacilli bacterium]|nr:ABC transporter ATP-binding protein [Bacilli bacterium]